MARPPAHPVPRTAVREAVVARAKRLLAQGYYDNTHVLEFAVARMIDDVASGRSASRRVSGATPGRDERKTDKPAGGRRRPTCP